MYKIGFNFKFFQAQSIMLLMLLITSCLPTQKKTECGDNEAFDGSKRKCVPVVGAASTGTVFVVSRSPSTAYTTNASGAPVVHKVAVSDVYNYGFTIKWYLHYTGTSTTTSAVVANNVDQYTFVPATLAGFFGTGSFVIEAIVYDKKGTSQLDSTSWNVAIHPYATPTLKSPSPAGTVFTYANNLTTATHTINLQNDGNISGNFRWYIDGTLIDGPTVGQYGSITGSSTFNAGTSGNSPAFSRSFNPSTLARGMHTIEFEIVSSGGEVYDSKVWSINIVDPDLPIITEILDNNNYDLVAAGTLYAIDSLAFRANGYQNNNSPQQEIQDICVTVDDYDKTTPGVSDIKLRVVLGGAIQHVATFTSNTYCLFANGDFSLPTQTLTVPESTINKTLTFMLIKDSDNTVLETYPLNLIVREENIAPQITIKHDGIATTNCDTSKLIHTENCTQTQSVDAENNGDTTDGGANVDNSKVYAINIVDIDETANFDVLYELRYENEPYEELDGNSQYSLENCSFNTGTVTNVASCTLNLTNYAANGPVKPGNYTLRATVTDNGSVFAPGDTKPSNSVTWKIAVTEYQSTGIYKTFVDVANTTVLNAGNSCANPGAPITMGAPITEGEYIKINAAIADYDRDEIGTVVFLMENALSPGAYKTLGTVSGVTKNLPTDLNGIATLCVQVPEWAVVGTELANVNLRIYATDAPFNSVNKTISDEGAIVVTSIRNNNHISKRPQFAGGNADVDLAMGRTVFPGHLFTITAPTITDASIFGGTQILWKWQMKDNVNVAWVDINGANSDDQPNDPNLYWTPTINIETNGVTDVDFRLCIGDDGYGNPADCSDADLTKNYLNVAVSPSGLYADATASVTPTGDEAASWYDATNNYHYLAYTEGNNISVEKTSISGTAINHIATVRFAAQHPDQTQGPASNLRMTGVDGQYLFLAYTVKENNFDALRIRRINLTLSGKEVLGFNYAGVYYPSGSANEIADQYFVAEDDPNITTDLTDDSDLVITFGGAANGNRLIRFRNPIDNTVYNIVAGTDYCVPMCANAAASASSLTSFINNNTGFIGTTFSAVNGGTTVTIRATGVADYKDVDDVPHAVKLGNIHITGGTELTVPYIDGIRNNIISLVKVSPISGVVSGSVTGSIPLSTTSLYNSEISSALNGSDEIIIATKASNGGIDLYKYNTGLAISDSALNITSGSISTFDEIDQVQVSVGMNDHIFVSAIGRNASSTEFNLLAGAIEKDFNSAVFKISTFSEFVNDFDKATIVASPTVEGEAVIAFTTKVAQTAHVMKIRGALSGGNFIAVDFPSEGDWSPPQLNLNDIDVGNAIAVTKINNITLGHEGSANTNNRSHSSFIFSMHEESGADREVRSILVNTDDSPVPSTSVGNAFSPPFIKNQ